MTVYATNSALTSVWAADSHGLRSKVIERSNTSIGAARREERVGGNEAGKGEDLSNGGGVHSC